MTDNELKANPIYNFVQISTFQYLILQFYNKFSQHILVTHIHFAGTYFRLI